MASFRVIKRSKKIKKSRFFWAFSRCCYCYCCCCWDYLQCCHCHWISWCFCSCCRWSYCYCCCCCCCCCLYCCCCCCKRCCQSCCQPSLRWPVHNGGPECKNSILGSGETRPNGLGRSSSWYLILIHISRWYALRKGGRLGGQRGS